MVAQGRAANHPRRNVIDARILPALIVAWALAAPAGAQMAGAQMPDAPDGRRIGQDGVPVCRAALAEYRAYAAEQWSKEAERYKRDGQPVSRNDDRRGLELEGGKSVELLDCVPRAIRAMPICTTAMTRPVASMPCERLPTRTSITRW